MQKIRTFVHSMRRRSVHTRQAILVGTSLGLTACIVFLYIAVLGLTSREDTIHKTTIDDSSSISSPLTIIKNTLGDAYNDATNSITSTKDK